MKCPKSTGAQGRDSQSLLCIRITKGLIRIQISGPCPKDSHLKSVRRIPIPVCCALTTNSLVFIWELLLKEHYVE